MSQNDPFWTNIFRNKTPEEKLLDTFSLLPLFSKLSKRQVKLLVSLVSESIYQPHPYKAGEVVFEQGQEGSGMYVILSGSIGIYLDYHLGDQNMVAVIEAGDFFGEINLLDELPRTATSVAMENSELIFFHGREFRAALESNPEIGYEVMRSLSGVLAGRLRETDYLLRKKDERLRELEIGAADSDGK